MSAAGDVPAIKFCGLTRDEDAALAASLGAAYVGVIFAGGPRVVTTERARELAAVARTHAGAGRAAPRAVGVFGAHAPEAIAERAREATLDVAQLHGDPDAALVEQVRARFAGEVWGVLRLDSAALPPHAAALFDAADAVVLDAKVAGHGFGGTGVALPWAALAGALAPLRRRARLVLAGGLRPENVAEAVATLAPHVVDVASGVERSPGVKDPDRMRAFAANARAARSGSAVSQE